MGPGRIPARRYGGGGRNAGGHHQGAENPRRADRRMSLAPLLAALAGPGQPAAAFAALDRALAATVGHRLFTVLVLDEARGVNRRCYSSQPVAYPVSGEKPLVRESELY